MRKILMVASAAAIAISMPAMAKDKDDRGERGGGKVEKSERGDRGGRGEKAERRGRGDGGERRAERRDRDDDSDRQERRAQRDRSDRQWARADRRDRDDDRRETRRDRDDDGDDRREARRDRDDDRRDFRGRRNDDRRELRRLVRDDRRFDRDDDRYRNRFVRAFDDCPPGLARKNNGCLPPGQARKLFAGQALPLAYYSDYNIPRQYQSWYRDTPDTYYRYDDGGYIYQVDRGSNLIESLIPLLGGGFGVGQVLPAGYDTYNLPMAYRDDYVDGDEAYYRYGDDAIYQVDPQTNMIESIVALLAGDLNVGGLLPGGYDTYNLPMDYRDQYADSDESMYRYADGNIYEVDPQSMIIEQIVASLA